MSKIFSFIFTLLLIAFAQSQECCNKNTISVIGSGAVSVEPDTAIFYVSAIANGKTSAQALSNVNDIINKTRVALQLLGFSLDNTTTVSINLYPVYNYSNGTSYIIGQQASQTLQVTVGDLNSNKNLLGYIAGNLSAVNNVSISGFTFQNSDKTQAFRAARRSAVADALWKAQQYSFLSNKTLSCVLSIVDQNSEAYIPFQLSPDYYAFRSQILSVPFGQVQVNANVQIKWRTLV